jgi:hypothetical protein
MKLAVVIAALVLGGCAGNADSPDPAGNGGGPGTSVGGAGGSAGMGGTGGLGGGPPASLPSGNELNSASGRASGATYSMDFQLGRTFHQRPAGAGDIALECAAPIH